MEDKIIDIEFPIIDTIATYNYHTWNISDSTFQASDFNFCNFFNNFLLKNLPCIIKNTTNDWECTEKWIRNNKVNYGYISAVYGDLDAPIADCDNMEYNSHCKSNMKVSEYMEILKEQDKPLYLKDWHLKRLRPDDNFYEVPSYFLLDWLNEYALDNQEDDFMFVYIGPTGSWTPLHEDVYCSYSWSVNIIGRKKWVFLPPGEEDKLRDLHGKLPVLFDSATHKNIKYYEIIQEKGDALFVPSGWHHQVLNEVETISINHNWINACNIECVWNALLKTLKSVEWEIEEFKHTPDFSFQCQLILKSIFGMDFETFFKFICYIAHKRLLQFNGVCNRKINKYNLGINIIKYDLISISKVMDSICSHPIFLKESINMKQDVLDINQQIKEAVLKNI